MFRLRDRIQKAVLNELSLTPAEYLGRFEKTSKRKDETWAQLASRVKTYLTYHLQSRQANTKEVMMELLVADQMIAALSTEGLEYVLLWEGEDWLKPDEAAIVLEAFEKAKGLSESETKPATAASAPQPAKLFEPAEDKFKVSFMSRTGPVS